MNNMIILINGRGKVCACDGKMREKSRRSPAPTVCHSYKTRWLPTVANRDGVTSKTEYSIAAKFIWPNDVDSSSHSRVRAPRCGEPKPRSHATTVFHYRDTNHRTIIRMYDSVIALF